MKRFIRRLILNILYFTCIGIFCLYAFNADFNDVKFWISISIFTIFLNVHNDIYNWINK